jgi:hypothetical protein
VGETNDVEIVGEHETPWLVLGGGSARARR